MRRRLLGWLGALRVGGVDWRAQTSAALDDELSATERAALERELETSDELREYASDLAFISQSFSVVRQAQAESQPMPSFELSEFDIGPMAPTTVAARPAAAAPPAGAAMRLRMAAAGTMAATAALAAVLSFSALDLASTGPSQAESVVLESAPVAASDSAAESQGAAVVEVNGSDDAPASESAASNPTPPADAPTPTSAADDDFAEEAEEEAAVAAVEVEAEEAAEEVVEELAEEEASEAEAQEAASENWAEQEAAQTAEADAETAAQEPGRQAVHAGQRAAEDDSSPELERESGARDREPAVAAVEEEKPEAAAEAEQGPPIESAEPADDAVAASADADTAEAETETETAAVSDTEPPAPQVQDEAVAQAATEQSAPQAETEAAGAGSAARQWNTGSRAVQTFTSVTEDQAAPAVDFGGENVGAGGDPEWLRPLQATLGGIAAGGLVLWIAFWLAERRRDAAF